jgi:hypothetical protein
MRIHMEKFVREVNCLLRAISHLRSGLDFRHRIRPLHLNNKYRIIGCLIRIATSPAGNLTATKCGRAVVWIDLPIRKAC